jgi:hypothetical protein
MQKLRLNRVGSKPTYVEIPDKCTLAIDMRAVFKYPKMYDTVHKRYVQPTGQYFVYWERVGISEWILHNEPLEEMIRMGYLHRPEFQPSIKKALTEGVNAKTGVDLLEFMKPRKTQGVAKRAKLLKDELIAKYGHTKFIKTEIVESINKFFPECE